jgi:hypothetical protein
MSAEEVNELAPGRFSPSGSQLPDFVVKRMAKYSRKLRRQLLAARRHPPLTHNCFFAGTTHAVLLLKRGHCDQLVRDIAGFSDEESPLVPLRAVYLAIWRAYQRKRDVCIDPEPLLQPLAMVVPEECQRAKDAETNLGNLCKSPLQ